MGKLEDFIGIPYVSKGRTIEGSDCWGIILLAAKSLYDLSLPDYTTYEDSCDGTQTEHIFNDRYVNWVDVPLDAKMPGDVIVLRIMGEPMHAALYLGDGKMLHTMSGRDSCIDRIGSQGWQNRIDGVYRWHK